MRTLYIIALESETKGIFEQRNISPIYCGVGKVNAAYALTKALATGKYDLVINFGTAGSPHFPRGSLVAANRFVQRDMDVQALGFAAYETPYDDLPILIEHEQYYSDLPHAICASGDSFVTQNMPDNLALFDMEAYAMAKICTLEGIRFACVKYVSDGANDDSPIDWEASLSDATRKFRSLV
jgi:adenosylhomocysteine nucleosidase